MEIIPGGYEFTQSWLNTFQLCPERARLEGFGREVRTETDATAVGTSVHTAIEHYMMNQDQASALSAARKHFDTLSAVPEMKWNATQSARTAKGWIENCFKAWLRDVYPKMGPIHPEYTERRMKMDLTENIVLSGATDAVADTPFEEFDSWQDVTVWDWKTGSRPYEAWEKERWAIQPRTYAALVREYMGLKYYPRFNYAMMLRNTKEVKTAQILPIETHEGHIHWITRLCEQAVRLYEVLGDTEPWPVMDQGWWCSEKWCPQWKDCKGAYLATGGSE